MITRNHTNFWFVSSYLFVAIAVSVPNYFPRNIRVMYVGFILGDSFNIVYEIFRHWYPFNLVSWNKFDKWRIYKSNYVL